MLFDMCIGRELVGNVKSNPDDKIGKKIVDMYYTGNTCFVKVALNKAGKVERCYCHYWNKSDQKQIGFDSFKYASAWKLKDVIDNIIVIFKEHDHGKYGVKCPDHSKFGRIGDKGIETFYNLFRLCRHKIFKDELLDFVIGLIKKRKGSEDIKYNDQQGNNREYGIPA